MKRINDTIHAIIFGCFIFTLLIFKFYHLIVLLRSLVFPTKTVQPLLRGANGNFASDGFQIIAHLPQEACISYEKLAERLRHEIRKERPGWVAGFNPYFAERTQEEIFQWLGAGGELGEAYDGRPYERIEEYDSFSERKSKFMVPTSFNAMSKWQYCASIIDTMRDQGYCGSCWAVASASVMSDRHCIGSNGTVQIYISDHNILTCSDGGSCKGGYPDRAFNYWRRTGVVTGGLYGSNVGCQPYTAPPFGQHTFKEHSSTPACSSKCSAGHNESYNKDKHFGKRVYQISYCAHCMQDELYQNGPIAASMTIYEDFLFYKSGVYRHVYGRRYGYHVVKIIGWGTEGGIPYWLGINIWNTTWGTEGFFKILRGTNECEIESETWAGTV